MEKTHCYDQDYESEGILIDTTKINPTTPADIPTTHHVHGCNLLLARLVGDANGDGEGEGECGGDNVVLLTIGIAIAKCPRPFDEQTPWLTTSLNSTGPLGIVMILGGISKEPKLAPLAHNVLLLNLKTETSMPEKLAGREEMEPIGTHPTLSQSPLNLQKDAIFAQKSSVFCALFEIEMHEMNDVMMIKRIGIKPSLESLIGSRMKVKEKMERLGLKA
ncbi:hypothetical protein Cgig2_000511 [Carnegiea gigantea]|uniref:Uncharacterized protein n=1 Tax=Carnegiea gigantea TaxID=171969 RepID=A0A9Q1JJ33_9CARY|nr:hypothetical protein Cgig2_000511 [Carnegiea gigantea]